MTGPPQSPRLARALLAIVLPRREREFVIGDLEEMFAAAIDSGTSVAAARRWYWRAAISSMTLRWRDDRDRQFDRGEPKRKGDGAMKNVVRDVRYGVRLLLRRPGFTATAALTLALGIGANTAIFTVIHALLLKPLPYDQPDQIVIVNENNLSRGWTSFAVSPANFLDWRSSAKSFKYLAAYGSAAFNYSGSGAPERLRGYNATEGFLEILGGTPAIGRGFVASDFEPGHDNVVILSHGFWMRAFGGRRDLVNETITLNGQPYTIVGVMHSQWRFGGRDIALFTPRSFAANERTARGGHYLRVIGRMQSGVTLDGMLKEMSAIATRLEKGYPGTNKGWGVTAASLQEAAVGSTRPMLILLFGAVGLVLLIACANLANMHLARATARAREIAIRTSIGAGRGRIISQLLTESVVLALVGGGFGLVLAYWATTSFVASYPTMLPRSGDIRINIWVLAFTTGLSIATALLFGVMPAMAASRLDLRETLKEGARPGGGSGRRMMRSALVVSEMALAIVLLVGAGLLLKSFVRLSRVEPGFHTENRVAVTTLLPRPKYDEENRQVTFYEQAVERLRARPGVKSVALASTVPLSGGDEIYSIAFDGRPPLPPGQGVSALYYLVSPNYFATMGIPILKGRVFTAADRSGAPRVAVVNDAFVKLHYPNEDPIGKRIFIGRNSGVAREVVGVVASVKHYGLTDREQAEMYEPFEQMPTTAMTFVIESQDGVDPMTLVPAVRREIQAVDADQPIAGATSIAQMTVDSSATSRVQTMLLGGFAAVAVVLAAIGLYGVMAYSVSERRQEIGIRMALGAHREKVLAMVFRQALSVTCLGLVIGVAGAIALGRLLASELEPMLFQVTPADTATLAIVPGILAVVALMAAWVPAMRASRVDPITALRAE